MKDRDSYVDVTKGLAILMVVRIHAECASYMHIPYPIIAVPLFFSLSGFYDRSERQLCSWLPKTIWSLVFTTVVWCIIGWCYETLLVILRSHDFGEVKYSGDIYNPLVGDGVTWFLVALFYAKVIVCGLLKFQNALLPSKFAYIVPYTTLAITFLLGFTSLYCNMPLLVDEGFAACPFYFMGKIIYPHLGYFIKNKMLVVLGVFCIVLMQMPFFPWVMVPLEPNHHVYMHFLFYIMIFVSFIPLLFIGHKICDFSFLRKLGQRTLGILVLHPLLLHTFAVVLNRIYEKGSLRWILSFTMAYVFVIIVSYYLTGLIERRYPILLGKVSNC